MSAIMLKIILEASNILGRFRGPVLFISSGCIAAVVQFGALFVLTHYFGVWYLISATIAFGCAFFVSFFLQKFITFIEHSKDRMGNQLVYYFLFALLNAGINAIIMYVEVDIIGLHYLVAQFISSAIIAFYSYFVYKRYIFYIAA
jgi:putative flippase GtrA